MKTIFRYISLGTAIAVVARGLYLVWLHLSGSLQGHYDALGVFMDYLVHFGLIAVVGLGFGIAGKSRVGIIGNLAHLIFAALIYFID